MIRSISEWLWRAAVISALVWIGWELHGIHADMFEPADEQVNTMAAPDADQGRVPVPSGTRGLSATAGPFCSSGAARSG